MPASRPTVAEVKVRGEKRLDDILAVEAAPADEFVSSICSLPWLRFDEVFDHPLTERGGFALPLLEFIILLKEVVLHQRGPGILGEFERIELNFSTRADASYDPESRIFRLNLGVFLFLTEIGATCEWLESVLFKSPARALRLSDLLRIEAPEAVRNELRSLFAAGGGGSLPVSARYGINHPIARMLLRFVLAHELAHLIDTAESPKLQADWRNVVWSDYVDALDYGVTSGWIDAARRAQLQRSALPKQVAEDWAAEFVADGLGFYTAATVRPPGSIDQRAAYSYLQVAVELFFHALVLVYRADMGTERHPPPMLRSLVIRTRRRKDHRADWPQFLSEHWGAGFAASELLHRAMNRIGLKTVVHKMGCRS